MSGVFVGLYYVGMPQAMAQNSLKKRSAASRLALCVALKAVLPCCGVIGGGLLDLLQLLNMLNDLHHTQL